MKKLIIILLAIFITGNIFAQSPQRISFQAVVRNSSNNLVLNTAVGMRVSILQGSIFGASVYVETQTPTTNSNGLVSLSIGSGTILAGSFSTINWANGPYFIKTETDPLGGTAYSIFGTSELLSVPYVLYASNSGNSTPGPQGPTGAIGIQGVAGVIGVVSGFTHYLGEAFNGGIIFYLYKGSDGLEHGLIVALTATTNLQWQSTASLVNANRPDDGLYNTNLMINSPAKNYIATLGTGWYLPSIDELSLLFHNRLTVQKALRAGGHTLISTAYYTSSTEASTTNFYFINMDKGTFNNGSKVTFNPVRGIRSF